MPIDKLTEDNMSGNCSIKLLSISNIDTIARSVDSRIVTPVTRIDTDGLDWEVLPAVRDTLDFAETPTDVDGIEVYQCIVSLEVSKDTYDRLNYLYNLTKDRFAIQVLDQNGLTRLIGKTTNGSKEGARLKILNRSTHPRPQLRNGYVLQFSYSSGVPIPFYTAS